MSPYNLDTNSSSSLMLSREAAESRAKRVTRAWRHSIGNIMPLSSTRLTNLPRLSFLGLQSPPPRSPDLASFVTQSTRPPSPLPHAITHSSMTHPIVQPVLPAPTTPPQVCSSTLLALTQPRSTTLLLSPAASDAESLDTLFASFTHSFGSDSSCTSSYLSEVSSYESDDDSDSDYQDEYDDIKDEDDEHARKEKEAEMDLLGELGPRNLRRGVALKRPNGATPKLQARRRSGAYLLSTDPETETAPSSSNYPTAAADSVDVLEPPPTRRPSVRASSLPTPLRPHLIKRPSLLALRAVENSSCPRMIPLDWSALSTLVELGPSETLPTPITVRSRPVTIHAASMPLVPCLHPVKSLKAVPEYRPPPPPLFEQPVPKPFSALGLSLGNRVQWPAVPLGTATLSTSTGTSTKLWSPATQHFPPHFSVAFPVPRPFPAWSPITFPVPQPHRPESTDGHSSSHICTCGSSSSSSSSNMQA